MPDGASVVGAAVASGDALGSAVAVSYTHLIMYCANDMHRYEGTYLQRASMFLEEIRRITNYFRERGIIVYYGIEPKCQTEDQSTFTARDAGWAAMKSAAEEMCIRDGPNTHIIIKVYCDF